MIRKLPSIQLPPVKKHNSIDSWWKRLLFKLKPLHHEYHDDGSSIEYKWWRGEKRIVRWNVVRKVKND